MDALGRATWILLAAEAALLGAIRLEGGIDDLVLEARLARPSGLDLPPLPFPAWVPEAADVLLVAALVLCPFALLTGLVLLPRRPAGMLPRAAKLALALVLSGWVVLAAAMGETLLWTYLGLLLILTVLILLPLVMAHETRSAGLAGVGAAWVGVALLPPATIALADSPWSPGSFAGIGLTYAAARAGAFAWTLWAAGRAQRSPPEVAAMDA